MLNLPFKMSHRRHNLRVQNLAVVCMGRRKSWKCMYSVIGDEDCLYLTVFTPITHSDRGIPIGITGLTYCTNGERYGSAGIQWDPLNKEVCVDNNCLFLLQWYYMLLIFNLFSVII
ncbi:unnamed protein product [Orchesella dallaii]|uniref:Uncharacterized protein n=1 Tax=Orchesella dallaii TaxID=48710 RepID=A0ABP1RIP6_9HEXA